MLDTPLLLPTPLAVLKTLWRLARTVLFWRTVLVSLARILLGIALALIGGSLLALLTFKSPFLHHLFSPLLTLFKATPVASIIIIIWILVGSINVPTAIALLMVCPIIWQATVEGLGSRKRDLDEVADIFGLSFKKRVKYIIIPRVIKNFMPALLTSVGLAWKSGIAAEIISVTKDSIGYYIKTNKDTFDAEYMFAWTGTVVIISLLFEFAIKRIARRIKPDA